MPAKTPAKNVQHVLAWRRRVKLRLIEAFGGACGICGYSRCVSNLAFHHLDPAQKEFQVGAFQSKSWDSLVTEVRKCVLLCHNCHGEVHAGIIDPGQCRRFDDAYANRLVRGRRTKGKCAACGGPLKTGNKFCSQRCAHIDQERAERPTRQDLHLLLSENTWEAAAYRFGVSSNAVRKWAIHYGLNIAEYGWRRNGGAGTDSNLRPER